MARRTFRRASATLARFLPVDLLYFLFLPYSAARGLPKAVRVRDFPAARVPPLRPKDRRPRFLTRWRYQTSVNHRFTGLILAGLANQERWAGRVTSDGEAKLDLVAADRPVVVMTLHTGAMIVLGGWLVRRGLGVGSVIIDRNLWSRSDFQKARSDPRWQEYMRNSGAFLAGDTRQMIRYLAPKRVLSLPADHPLGRTAEGTWPGGRLKMATGGLRIARMTGASVFPVIVTDAGRWRFHVHVGTPLPDALLATNNDEAAVTEIVRQLMPIVASRPFEANPTIINAVSAPRSPDRGAAG